MKGEKGQIDGDYRGTKSSHPRGRGQVRLNGHVDNGTRRSSHHVAIIDNAHAMIVCDATISTYVASSLKSRRRFSADQVYVLGLLRVP